MERLILAGAGHGHIQILSKLQEMDLGDLQVTVITNFDRQFYSGMLPGYVNGHFTLDDVTFTVKDYCNNPNIELIFDIIVEIDGTRNMVKTKNGAYRFDYLCMNVGSKSIESFGPANDTLHYVKPINGFKTLKDLGEGARSLLIVGGGAAGVELALAYRYRYPDMKIKIADRHDDILLKFNKKTQTIAKKLLKERSIGVFCDVDIKKIERNHAYYKGGEIEFDQALVSTGVTGADINYRGFDVDEENFVKVDDDLFAAENVLAIGDMVHMRKYPHMPKAGVFAIRMTPILVNNVFQIIFGGGEIKNYVPQKMYLQIINTSDGKAILSRGPFAMYNALALTIKNKIDLDYMNGNLVTDSLVKKFRTERKTANK
ncbi:MAG: FAD-dependent oxidoreductase [Peptoniphilus sp.]|nr:FAD-dependent oxidoreductase [Peptoniphilus sp.]MDY6044389.1 FAD-dependent oxidoreductase [Peptoniphilus sp.]